IGDDNVVEGNNLIYTVSLSAATSNVSTYAYSLGGGTATAGSDYNTTPTFSNGVTLVGGNLIVPSGVTSFTVTVATINDVVVDSASPETLPLVVGGVTGNGGIIDNDQPTITTVEPGAPGTGDNNVVEGTNLVYTVSLSSPTTIASTYAYALGGGTATSGADYNATPTFSNGVTLVGGNLIVPAGVTNFTVTVATIDDAVVDSASPETLPLVIAGVTGNGGITDNEPLPTASVTNVTVAESGGFAQFTLSLSGISSVATTFDLALANVSATGVGVDYGSGGANNLQISTNGGGTWINATSVTIAAGLTSVLVRTPVNTDNLVEPSETFTLTATRTAGVTSNASAVGTATITDNVLPTVAAQARSVSEEGLTSGIADTVGNPSDSTNSTSTSGTMTATDPDGTVTAWSLTSAPVGITSNGVAVTWNLVGQTYTGTAGATQVATLTINSATGAYNFNLLAPIDHATAGSEDIRALNFGVGASDGFGVGTGTLTINVEDDSPVTTVFTHQLFVGVDTISVNDLDAGFVNAVNTSGGAVTGVNVDATDAFVDRLLWGTGNPQSGYELVDTVGFTSAAGTAVTLGQLFEVGKFTHNNFPVSGASLDKTDLTISFDVVINGVSTNVPFTVVLDHTETTNTADPEASKDIIDLPATSSTINIAGQNYVVNLNGFKDANGNLVTQIKTSENAASTFGIFASVTTVEPLPVASGRVLAQGGADGLTNTVNWSGSSTYGTFVGNANGTYTFTMNEATRSSIATGTQLTASFNYTFTDKDGDTSTNVLNIQMGGYRNLEGTTGADTLTGQNSVADILFGYGGNDTLSGNSGDDVLIGGTGNDSMTGGAGADTFKWGLNDNGTTAALAIDRITDFGTATFAAGGDRLDLRDLLVGESSSTLEKFLHFNWDGTNTTLYVSTSGAFNAGNVLASNPTNVTSNDVQQIIFNGVNLTTGFTTDLQLINDLIAKGKIITD
ncbi:choice-of-anchor K domain-containing protein, partial [Undibacterium seohonense]